MEEVMAKSAVRAIQRGNADMAKWDMQSAAMERHLVFELFDTWDIAREAYHEWVCGRASNSPCP